MARGRDRIERALETGGRRTAELRATLRALSPASTLARGYAIAHLSDGVIVRDASQAPAGTGLVVTVGRGSFAARSEGAIAEDGCADRHPTPRERVLRRTKMEA